MVNRLTALIIFGALAFRNFVRVALLELERHVFGADRGIPERAQIACVQQHLHRVCARSANSWSNPCVVVGSGASGLNVPGVNVTLSPV